MINLDRMKIAINTRFLIKDKMEGIGVFTHESLKRIVSAQTSHEFYFFFDRPFDDSFIYAENVHPIVLRPPARHPVLWYAWFEISLKRALKRLSPDIFLSPDGFLPLNLNIPSVVVIHDLAFEHYPHDVPPLVSRYYRHFFPKFARQAGRIATVSEFSQKDLTLQYGVDPGNIDVVYNGASDMFSPVDDMIKKSIRNKYTFGHPYFVYVGALHQRKNIHSLLVAYDEFRKISGENIKLIICGRSFGKNKQAEEAYQKMEHKEDVVFTGRLPLEELIKVTASALAMVNVSYFEGFGIPLAEAMNCHVPIIASDNTSFPEVAGDAALLVNPFNIPGIAEAMKTVAENHSKREKLTRNCIDRKNLFSWDKTASLLWGSIEKLINEQK